MGLICSMVWPEGHRLAFWQFEATHDAILPETWPAADSGEYARCANEKRQHEWLASRWALRTGLAITEEVLYAPSGKPRLASQELSFSHCLPLAGVLVHPANAGMDIQSNHPKLLKIKERFAHAEELADAAASTDELSYITLLWSAKEALFKCYGEDLPFAEGIRIARFAIGASELQAEVTHRGVRRLHHLRVFRLLNQWVVVAL